MVLRETWREGWALAAVERCSWREKDLGRGETAGPVVHVREAVLVVQHVQRRRLLGDAAADYPADGRKIPDIYTSPDLRDELNARLGTFPLFNFWGPKPTSARRSWIADAASTIDAKSRPTLTLVYLPHLDYNLQRLGPDDPDRERPARGGRGRAGSSSSRAKRDGARVVVLSEYGITAVSGAGPHQPRVARARACCGCARSRAGEAGRGRVARRSRWRTTRWRTSMSRTRSDVGGEGAARALRRGGTVLDEEGKRASGSITRGRRARGRRPERRWFTYYFWLDDAQGARLRAHGRYPPQAGVRPGGAVRDPGDLLAPAARSAGRCSKKKLGFRYLMDVIPLDASMVREALTAG